MWDRILKYWTEHSETFNHIILDTAKIIVFFIVSRIAIVICTRVVRQFFKIQGKLDDRRRETLVSLFSNIIKYVVYFIFLLTVLPIVGINITGILASAGVAGIAIAFGAQSLIKDFFNGFFIIFEDQYGVGDYVKINNVTGTVHSIGLRMTAIKLWTGEVEMIPNGQITQVTNYSKFNSIAVIEVNVGYGTPEAEAIAIIEKVMNDLKQESADIVGDVEVLGVQSLNDYNYTIRATAECAPNTHWGIERLARQRIRAALQEAGVDLPYQKIIYLHKEKDEQSDRERS
ncbi:mechanosensitive ion channel family protein [Tuberibacillus calidus]|jgi:small conductance mechanosensitive channel|uniref:mechanosensitive ion channel family protein n=1 Tax=Tuberibacillus calidus TaxID=340097 RepID=UPI00041317EC|nr:mechanosensitive ion channel family protein [Tuberibacillus calidus]